ncbi:MAG: POTRA domain-containing protein [Bacteroidota bacterium]
MSDSVKRPNKRHLVHDSTGTFVQVNRIFIIGNRLTRDGIILRELSVKQGDVVHSDDLPAILEICKKRLINTRLFNTVDIRTLELEPQKIDLLVDLNERWYTFPSLIFELSDRNFNEWWQTYNHDFRRVNYGLRLFQYNMRGRNETLRFVAQFGFVRRFELAYKFPYIDKKQKQGLVIEMDFSETKNLPFRTLDHKLEFAKSQDILRVTKGIGLSYTYRNSFYESHAVKAEYRNNSISDTVATLNPNYLGQEHTKQEYAALTYQFISDHRDYVGYPLRGYYLAANAIKSGLSAGDDLDRLESNLTFARFFDLKKGFYLSNNIVGYWSNRKNLPYYNYGAMGYKRNFIRGYEIYVIEGPRYFFNKTTFKKRIFSRTYHWRAMPIPQFRHIPLSLYLKGYADFGYVKNYPDYTLNMRLSDKWISGFGAGIDIVGSYDAVIRFEYTFNAEGERGFFIHIKKEF